MKGRGKKRRKLKQENLPDPKDGGLTMKKTARDCAAASVSIEKIVPTRANCCEEEREEAG